MNGICDKCKRNGNVDVYFGYNLCEEKCIPQLESFLPYFLKNAYQTFEATE